MTAYELFVIEGPEEDQAYEIVDDVTTIGRDRSCQICLKNSTVSRYHAKIMRSGDTITVEDLGSNNGTLVNGVRVKTNSLQVNDLVTLGRVVMQLRQVPYMHSLSRKPLTSEVAEDDVTRILQFPDQNQLAREDFEPASIMNITQSLSSSDLSVSSNHSLRTIYRITRMASSVFDLDVLLNKILDEIFNTINAERAFILLIDASSDELEIKASRWRDKEGLDHKISISQNIISHVLEKRESVLIDDAMVDSMFSLAESVITHKIRSAMCSPLRGRKRIVGIIHVDTSTSLGEFSQEDLMLLDAVCNAAGIAVENAQLYREKIQNERLAAMGQAISGLAHYIKNIIGAMQASQEMLQKGLDTKDLELSQRMWKILALSTERIGNLALDMLAFSRETKMETQSYQINDICNEVAALCQERIRSKKGELRLDLDPDLPEIHVNAQGIHRSLLNLLTNAIDALDEAGGEVKIYTSRQRESQVQIEVQDNGAGMRKEICHRIFDIFFTTKGDEGSGLGLAVTKKIIEDHGGSIEVQSVLGGGTEFAIKLPLETGTNKTNKGKN